MFAAEVTVTCPCCRDGVHDRRDVYLYARPYLCALHQSIFDAANENAHRSGACPWSPRACKRCGIGETA